MIFRIFFSFLIFCSCLLHGEEKSIFITGVCGFIGYSLANKLIDLGYEVYGCDNMSSYYDITLKKDRRALLQKKGLHFFETDIRDLKTLSYLFEKKQFANFIHLAAQAGVRFSLTNPEEYITHNIVGFFEVLEFCKNFTNMRLIYASSSSVYGDNSEFPQDEEMKISSPNSLYSATKISNELFARVYHNVHGLKSVGLRFFTVYGPWGRPDMAHFKFATAIKRGEPLILFNNGEIYRDFTYIDDIVNGILRVIESNLEFEILNLGKGNPDKVKNLVVYLEKEIGKKANIVSEPLSRVEVLKTYADIGKAQKLLGYSPKIDLKFGIHLYMEWFNNYYSDANAEFE